MSRSFPRTPRTWIEERLGEGEAGLAEINRHLMRVYAEPLEAYLRRTRWRGLGDPGDLVRGFFADRLSRPRFLHGWRASEKRLRHWLWNALVFHLKESARERRREGHRVELDREPAADSPSPEEAFDRAFAVSLVRAALELTQERLAARGLASHFEVFRAHEWDELPYDEIARGRCVSADRARIMARTARDAFRRALRGLLLRDTGTGAEVDREIAGLLELLR